MEPADPGEWRVVADEPAYAGWVRVRHRTFEMPDGSRSQWDIIDGSRTVAVVARTTTGQFLLVRQFRPGPQRMLDEVPGGYSHGDETIEQTAARELLEETGYRAGAITVVGSTWMTANASIERFVAVAEDCVKVAEPSFDRDEYGRVLLVDAADLLTLVRSGQLTDQGVVYRALDYLGLLSGS